MAYTIKRYNGSSWDKIYPITTVDAVINLSSYLADIYNDIDGKQATITGAATSITGSNLTANRAVISNASGKVAASSIISTELGHLSGVTSNIQGQLNGKVSTGRTINGKALSSDITLNAGDVGAAPEVHNHDTRYYTQSQVDTKLGTKEPSITKGTASQYFDGTMSLKTFPTTMTPAAHALNDTNRHTGTLNISQLQKSTEDGQVIRGYGSSTNPSWARLSATDLNMSTARILGRTTAGTGAVEELPVASVQAFLGLGSAAYTATTAYRSSSWTPTWSQVTSKPTNLIQRTAWDSTNKILTIGVV